VTTLREARKAIHDKWTTDWPLVAPDVPFYFDNEAVTPCQTPWTRLVVRELVSTQDTLGLPTDRKFRRRAMVLVQVFVQRDVGVGSMVDLAHSARGVFEGKSFSGLDFHAVDAREVPTEDRWYQMTVEAQFNYYETK
jgi:hypothetical protein